MAKMTRTQAIAEVAAKTDLSKKVVALVLETEYDLAIKEVKKNGQFVLGAFGKLVKAKRAARVGRNPQTGAAIKIPAKTVVKFRLAKGVKDALLK